MKKILSASVSLLLAILFTAGCFTAAGINSYTSQSDTLTTVSNKRPAADVGSNASFKTAQKSDESDSSLAEVAATSSALTMVVSSGCYVYSKKSSATANRYDFITFGTEATVNELDGSWAYITYKAEGKTKKAYILVKNMKYKTMTVIKNRVLASPVAAGRKYEKSLGYVYYGAEVSLLSPSTNSAYVHCLIPVTYKEDGKTVMNKNVEGYINADYLRTTSVPKIVSSGSNLYSYAYSSSISPASMKTVAAKITSGEEVSLLMSNSSWSKILYNNKTYYISTDRLESKKLQILVGRAVQTLDAKPGSGFRHYAYWNSDITVLNTYESGIYGTYYYCLISGDYGFIRQFSDAGQQYIGYSVKRTLLAGSKIYTTASSSSTVKKKTGKDIEVTIRFQNSSWAQVETADGIIGYALTKYLSGDDYLASGNYYSSGANLYKDKPAGAIEDEKVKLLSTYPSRNFALVETENGKRLFMKASSVIPIESESTVYTSVPVCTLRKERDSSSAGIEIPYMSEVTLVTTYPDSPGGHWLKLRYNNTEYFMWEEEGVSRLTDKKSDFTDYTTYTSCQRDIIDAALRFLYLPTGYAHLQSTGDPDPRDGKYYFDCSGFAAYIYDTVMCQYAPTYDLSGTIEVLYATENILNKDLDGELNCATVLDASTGFDESRMLPGDIIFFNLHDEEEEREVTHCGIYLGRGEFIHCTYSWDGGVCVMPMKGTYIENFVAVRRYLPETDEVVQADKTMYTVSQSNYVYSQKNVDSEKVTTLDADTAVNIMFTSGNWAYISCGAVSGFILLSNLTDTLTVTDETRYIAKTTQKLYTSRTVYSDYAEVYLSEEVQYRGRYSDSNFYRVVYNGQLYYIYCPDTVGIDSIIKKTKAEVYSVSSTKYTTADTPLRLTPSTVDTENIILEIKDNHSVGVIAESDSGTWSFVKYNNDYGYVLTKYLTDTQNVTSETRYIAKTSQKLYSDRTVYGDYVEVYLGAEVTYQGRYSETKFYKVIYENQLYYIYCADTVSIDSIIKPSKTDVYSVSSTKYTTADTALRLTPSTVDTDNFILEIKENHSVGVIAVSDSGTWSFVKYNNDYGYVLTKYLTDTPNETSETRYIAKTSQKLYTERTVNSEYKEVYIGTEVTYTGRYSETKFYKVMYNNQLYYIYCADEKEIGSIIKPSLTDALSVKYSARVISGTNLRSTPNTSSTDNIVGSVKKDSTVGVIAVSDSGTWAYVISDDGVRGFLLLTKLSSTSVE